MLFTMAIGAAIASTAPQSSEITIYNQGFGLVKEVRMMELRAGRQTVAIEDVAAMIEPASVGIKSLTAADSFDVLEQNYQFDLINPIAILNKSVGQQIRFVRAFGNQKETLTGILMSAPTAIVGTPEGGSYQTYNGMVIKTDDGRIVLNPTGEVEVTSVPEGLISVPTLLWDLQAAKAGPNTVELSYLTQGINWNADYVLTLSNTEQKADLKGWVTVNNQSGATYKEAKLKLIAGDVQRIMNRPQRGMAGGGGVFAEAKSTGFAEEAFFEYHLYTLQRPATIRNKEIKQLSLLDGTGLTYRKKLIVDSMYGYWAYTPNEGTIGVGDVKPQVRIEFKNSKENMLGMPLPKGKVKVYQRDKAGSVQMLGEDEIDHTPRDENLSLVVGRSFDIRATRKRTNYRRISGNEFEETFEIELRNRKEVADTVHVVERHWHDWRITAQSMKWTKLDSNAMEFVVPLKAGETKTISYTVVTRW